MSLHKGCLISVLHFLCVILESTHLALGQVFLPELSAVKTGGPDGVSNILPYPGATNTINGMGYTHYSGSSVDTSPWPPYGGMSTPGKGMFPSLIDPGPVFHNVFYERPGGIFGAGGSKPTYPTTGHIPNTLAYPGPFQGPGYGPNVLAYPGTPSMYIPPSQTGTGQPTPGNGSTGGGQPTRPGPGPAQPGGGFPFLIEGYGGRLLDPPNRSSLWRSGVRGAPINPMDNQVNCGASWVPGSTTDKDEQHCGVCGDPAIGPQDHVLGGRYAMFPPFVSRGYPAVGGFPVTFFLNHSIVPGWDKVTFHLCPLNQRFSAVTWDCFAENPSLEILGWGNAYYPGRPGVHQVWLQVPPTFSCPHCVLQWRWQSSHTIDSFKCSRQPWLRACYLPIEYINCADIRIQPAVYNNPLALLLLAGAS